MQKLSLLSALVASCSMQAATQPDIVLINVDDLGWSDLTCMGSKYYQTPNIDRLAAQSVVFTNAYASAANCAPSRACLLTGQNTPRHGVYTVANSDRGKAKDRKLIPIQNTKSIDPSNTTFGTLLKQNGYRTASIGKWHVSKDPRPHGFDLNIGGSHEGGPYRGGYHSPFNYPNAKVNQPNIYLTDYLTDQAIQFINHDDPRPYLLYLPYYAVHFPLQAKKELIEKYKALPKSEAHFNQVYAAMIETLDQNIGRLMQNLEKHGKLDQTVIIFTSDNGGVWKTSHQWPLRAGKGAYYEGGIREPLFVHYPSKFKPQQVAAPVSQLDLFPTLLALSKTPKPENKLLDGLSLMPLLNGKTIKERPLFWHFPIYLESYTNNPETRDLKFRTRPGSVIRLGDWKLHEYFEDGGLELYNLKKDPSEKQNLAKKHPQITQKLQQMLQSWREQTDAPVPTELNPKYQP